MPNDKNKFPVAGSIPAKKIKFFEKFTKSFNPQFSREVVKFSLREGLKYLFFLTLLVSLIFSLKYTFSFYILTKTLPLQAEKFFLKNFSDFPEITIKDGEVSSTKDPFIRKWFDEKGELIAVFIVDTRAKREDIASGEYASYPQGFFLFKREFITKIIDEGGKESIEYTTIPKKLQVKITFSPEEKKFIGLEWDSEKFELTPQTIKKWRDTLSLAMPFFLIFVLFMITFLGKVFQILVFSVFSLLVNKI